MKTTKLIAIALILGIASMGMAQSTTTPYQVPDKNSQSIVIQLKQAMQIPALIKSMRTQLNPNFLKVEKPCYTVPVKYKKRIQYVTGTCNEWEIFFHIKQNGFHEGGIGSKIALRQALKNPTLLRSMRAQLSPAILKSEKPVYTVPVKYKHSVVYVTGRYDEWKRFFSVKQKVNPIR